MINDALPAATRSDLHIFAAVVGIMLLDGVKHVVVTTLFRDYTPGVITAVLVEIPYAAWMLHQMFNEKLIDSTALSRDTGAGIMGIAVLFMVAFGMGRVLMPLPRAGTMAGKM